MVLFVGNWGQKTYSTYRGYNLICKLVFGPTLYLGEDFQFEKCHRKCKHIVDGSKKSG